MTKVKRTRLLPEDRHTQLLDVTQSIILEYGLNSFTMEGLASAAGVSNPLVYKYFDTRLELLQTLLLREYHTFYDRNMDELKKAVTFEELINLSVSVNFDQQSKNGNIIAVLESHADIDAILKPIKTRRNVGRFLVSEMMKNYPFSTRQAIQIAEMASSASIAAAKNYQENGGNRQQLIMSTVQFIFGGINALVKA
ncbi:MAG: AcrR family transcriptional regulator [Paraglaciecola psychrophila]|jgi:AcrR family transcriptional regulator